MAQAFEERLGTMEEIALHRSLGVAYCAAGWALPAASSARQRKCVASRRASADCSGAAGAARWPAVPGTSSEGRGKAAGRVGGGPLRRLRDCGHQRRDFYPIGHQRKCTGRGSRAAAADTLCSAASSSPPRPSGTASTTPRPLAPTKTSSKMHSSLGGSGLRGRVSSAPAGEVPRGRATSGSRAAPPGRTRTGSRRPSRAASPRRSPRACVRDPRRSSSLQAVAGRDRSASPVRAPRPP